MFFLLSVPVFCRLPDHRRIHLLQVFCPGADHHGLQLVVRLLQRLLDPFRAVFLQRSHQRLAHGYSIRTAGSLGIHSPVRMLSGGNQQKIILAREITPKASFIVASQPTRGLDVSASAFVHEKLLEQKALGKGILLISADLEEILAMSDRIAVMYNGRVAGVLRREEATVEKIGRLMGGLTEGKEEIA